MAASTAFCWEVVKFDEGAAEVLALLEPELVSGAVTVFVGPGTVFEPMNRGPLANVRIPNDIPDGTSNTILAVEAGKPVIWTKPDDLPFDPQKALPPLGGLFPDGFHAALCDGSVRFIRRTVPASTLRLLIIRNDGNPIPDY